MYVGVCRVYRSVCGTGPYNISFISSVCVCVRVRGMSDYEEALQKFRISQEPFCFTSDGELLMWKWCNK